jgi:hypothetical protein
MQHILVAIYQLFGTTFRLHLQESSSPRRPLKKGQISCLTTSVTISHNALRNIPEQRRSHLYCGPRLKSRQSIWRINFRNLSPTLVFSAFLYYSIHFHSYYLSFPTVVVLSAFCNSFGTQRASTSLQKNCKFYVRHTRNVSASSVHVHQHTSVYTFRDVKVRTCLVQYSVRTVQGY